MKLFKKNNWSKWEHVMFVEDFRVGIPTFELLKRTDLDTGLTQYKKIKVASCVYNLHFNLQKLLTKK